MSVQGLDEPKGNRLSQKKAVADRIKILRLSSGFTQQGMAEKLNISERLLAYIESGDRTLSITNAEKICQLFSVSLDYLYLGITSETNVDPIGQLITKAISQIEDEEVKDFFIKTIVNLTSLMIKNK